MKNITKLNCSIIGQNLLNGLKFSPTRLRRQNIGIAKSTRAYLDSGKQAKTSTPRKRFSMLVCWLCLMSSSPLVFAALFQAVVDIYSEDDPTFGFILALPFKEITKNAPNKTLRFTQNPSTIFHGAYISDTDRYTTDLDEPLIEGMTHTMWRNYEPTRNERVILNTYGSNSFTSPGELDTQLAVYRIDKSNGASGYKSLQRVAANDNKRVIGGFGLGSLVQFDAQKGQTYAIQVGSKPGGGYIVLTGFSFPLSGGLSVQPDNIGGGYDPTRLFGSGKATYIIHNSTAKTLQVKASTTLGAGIDLPKPFNLAAGATTVKTVSLNSSFDRVTNRTESGEVAFSGFAGKTLAAKSVIPTLLPVNGSFLEDSTLQVSSTAQVFSGGTGEAFYWPIKVKNTGKFPAIGCYVWNNLVNSEVAWASYDPIAKIVNGEPNAPFDLPVGKSKDVLVAVRFFRDRLADPLYAASAEVLCLNARRPDIGNPDLSSNVDFTTTVTKYPKLSLVKTIPASGIFDVSASGKTFTATFYNASNQTANVTAEVETSFDIDTNKRFIASVCPVTTSDKDCLQATTKTYSELPISVAANKNITLKVAVKPPTGSPVFATNYGLSLLLMHDEKFNGLRRFIPVGGITKALRKQ
jgi:hypothetical protein